MLDIASSDSSFCHSRLNGYLSVKLPKTPPTKLIFASAMNQNRAWMHPIFILQLQKAPLLAYE